MKSQQELTQLFIQERIDTLQKEIHGASGPHRLDCAARLSELRMIQVIAGKVVPQQETKEVH